MAITFEYKNENLRFDDQLERNLQTAVRLLTVSLIKRPVKNVSIEGKSEGYIYLGHRARICDMIKGNESLVENSNFYFLTPLSQNIKMLHFDVNPITIGYLVTEL